jgi:hypothetical protein
MYNYNFSNEERGAINRLFLPFDPETVRGSGGLGDGVGEFTCTAVRPGAYTLPIGAASSVIAWGNQHISTTSVPGITVTLNSGLPIALAADTNTDALHSGYWSFKNANSSGVFFAGDTIAGGEIASAAQDVVASQPIRLMGGGMRVSVAYSNTASGADSTGLTYVGAVPSAGEDTIELYKTGASGALNASVKMVNLPPTSGARCAERRVSTVDPKKEVILRRKIDLLDRQFGRPSFKSVMINPDITGTTLRYGNLIQGTDTNSQPMALLNTDISFYMANGLPAGSTMNMQTVDYVELKPPVNGGSNGNFGFADKVQNLGADFLDMLMAANNLIPLWHYAEDSATFKLKVYAMCSKLMGGRKRPPLAQLDTRAHIRTVAQPAKPQAGKKPTPAPAAGGKPRKGANPTRNGFRGGASRPAVSFKEEL